MRELERAIEVTEKMQKLLATEVEHAREQRVFLRNMDAQGLFLRAQERSEFNGRMANLQQSLAEHLSDAARVMGIKEVTTEQLRAHAPGPGKRLDNAFGELRAQAAALQEIDTLNNLLAQRALSFVRGYVSAMTGRADVYDRRGITTGAERVSTASRIA